MGIFVQIHNLDPSGESDLLVCLCALAALRLCKKSMDRTRMKWIRYNINSTTPGADFVDFNGTLNRRSYLRHLKCRSDRGSVLIHLPPTWLLLLVDRHFTTQNIIGQLSFGTSRS